MSLRAWRAVQGYVVTQSKYIRTHTPLNILLLSVFIIITLHHPARPCPRSKVYTFPGRDPALPVALLHISSLTNFSGRLLFEPFLSSFSVSVSDNNNNKSNNKIFTVIHAKWYHPIPSINHMYAHIIGIWERLRVSYWWRMHNLQQTKKNHPMSTDLSVVALVYLRLFSTI